MKKFLLLIYRIYALAFLGILWGIVILSSFPLSLFGEKGKEWLWYFFHYCNRIWLIAAGIRVQVENVAGEQEAISDKKRYIIISNHSSYIDTQILYGHCPVPFKILGEQEYSKVPLFGFFYKQVAVLIKRKNKLSRQNGIRQLSRFINKKWNVFIFPEGGIGVNPDTLLPFHNGAFWLATKSNTSILPVVLPDAIKRAPKGSLWNINPGICRIIILPEMRVEDFENVESFKDSAFQQMNKAIINANRLRVK